MYKIIKNNTVSTIDLESAKPYIFQLFGRGIPQLIGMAISSVIVLNGGTKVFGEYSLMIAPIVFIFGVLGTSLDKDFQRSCESNNIKNVLSTKFVLWLLSLPILFFICWLSDISQISMFLIAIGIYFQQSIESIVVRDRIIGSDINALFLRIPPVLLFLIFLLIFRPKTVIEVATIFAISWMTVLFYIYPIIMKIKISFFTSIDYVRYLMPIWFSTLITQVYGNLDLYIIKYFHTEDAVGSYKLAYIFAGMIMPVASVFSFIYLSKISEAIKRNNIRLIRVVMRRQVLIGLILGFGLILFIFTVFPFVGKILYGSAVNKLILPARIISIAMALNILMMVYSYTLLANHFDKEIAAITFIGAIIYLVAAYFLIKYYAATGAGMAMILTYLLQLIMYHLIYKNKLLRLKPVKKSRKE